MSIRVPSYELIIVGLGPVGAVAANLAGAAGLKTLVVERAAEPYLLPRAIVFDAEIMRIFASIGLAAEVARHSRALEGSIYLGADHHPIRSFRAPPPANDQGWPSSNLFYQPQLEAILRSGLARFGNVTVLREHEVTALDRGETAATLTLSDLAAHAQVQVEGEFVLACDGASSTVRKALDIPLHDFGFEERWLVVDSNVNGPMRWPDDHEIPDEVREGRFSLMVCDPERPATLIPGVGLHRRWEYMLLPGELPQDKVPPDWLDGLLAKWVDPLDVEIIRLAVYRFRALVAAQWRCGNVFLVGDAAHQTPPFYGQGMCHGIRDAAQLIWKLVLVQRGRSAPALLDSYQAEREPHVRAIIAASVAAGAAVCTLDPAQARVRDAAFRAAEASRDGRTVAMADVVPPIVAGTIDPQTGGARLPVFALKTEGGEAVPMDALIGTGFALLRLDPPTDALPWEAQAIGMVPLTVRSEGRGALRDLDGALAAWFGACHADWAIIRPDRYVHSTGLGDAGLAAGLAMLGRQLHLADPALSSAPGPQRTKATAS